MVDYHWPMMNGKLVRVTTVIQQPHRLMIKDSNLQGRPSCSLLSIHSLSIWALAPFFSWIAAGLHPETVDIIKPSCPTSFLKVHTKQMSRCLFSLEGSDWFKVVHMTQDKPTRALRQTLAVSEEQKDSFPTGLLS